MKIAIFGDLHGNIKQMYRAASSIERSIDENIPLVIQLGDFQAIRDERDLRYFPVPAKHRTIGDFPFFYNQGDVPKQTFFIGGNHDNNYWHSDHPNGYELIEGLNYLGRSGVKTIGNLTFGWISGNYSPKGFTKEKKKPRYNHFTQEDIDKILQSEGNIDILFFHDWPSIIELSKGIVSESVSDPETLEQVQYRDLGNIPLYEVVERVKPKYVFAGHMHIPLDFKTLVGGSEVRFIGVNKFERANSVYLLDTATSEIGTLSRNKGNLLDLIEQPEKGLVAAAFKDLESDDLDTARQFFESVLSGDFSSEAVSLANYGLGVVHSKQAGTNGFQRQDIEKSIGFFRKSLEVFEHADTHLMLGYSQIAKISDIHTRGTSTDERDKGIINLIDQAVFSFNRAAKLNPRYIALLKSL